ncbi:hypothetical protein PGT21_025099 [Puccinia graminis f. sp. tritici]|uniref:Uncharacterized protein n=2 Tax=Puccinia graminis f. sp. tritici TaxID=56615 RepID=E3KST3_PUCGT|nr:uncharacterized protein PGTG_13691 [Puccinia graminis f. sp. tritici CRL 75-36-700-3]EFP87463.1 hypothetical protein PGTG_13691 [Puccinia graminis f. sp. tritici CRL 75-36-700-3]KAA1093097.1 hypothetical protein PGT21_025099 [Puccinia graminis f. sp. tritici]KAA1127732.1 hypothetical protein PGTUg99_006768 [Puccinia graminis f. sp. tritici]
MCDTVKTSSGAEITVCTPHQLEMCHRCGMCFVDMNNEARAEAQMAKAARQHEDGDPLDPGQLRVGTEVRMRDESGRNPPKPLDGRIVGVTEEINEESDFCGETCYVIKLRDNSLMTYPVDWVHEEWSVKIDGHYIAASKVLQLVSS